MNECDKATDHKVYLCGEKKEKTTDEHDFYCKPAKMFMDSKGRGWPATPNFMMEADGSHTGLFHACNSATFGGLPVLQPITCSG